MKQGTPPPPPTPRRNECRPTATDMSQSTTPSRLRAYSKPKESPKPPEATTNRVSSARAVTKSATPEAIANSKTRRALLVSKHKAGEDVVVGSQKGREVVEVKVVGRSGNRQVVEEFARPQQRRPAVDDPDRKMKELQEKLELSEASVKNLQAELDKAHSFNVELQSQNKKLAEDLAAAEAKIATLSCHDQRESIRDYQSPKFRDIQKLIASKLEHPKVKKEALIDASSTQKPPSPPPPPPPICPIPKLVNVERKAPPYSSLPLPPPPPPPPPPTRPSARAGTTQKAPSVVEFYHSLAKQEGKRDSPRSGNHHKPASVSAHSSIVGEIQNRSAHLLAIKADIETKGEFINGLIQKVLAAAYADIEDVLKFVDWLDNELSSLADERAVLRHFKWPERKADVMREAAIEYRDLKLLESEISSYKDDTLIPCGVALKKMASLLDKSERSLQRLIKLRNSVTRSYQDYKVPTDWMLDSGIVSKIKQASMNLAKMYMKRVTLELESIRNSDRESSQESLLLQGVHFAYRAHQFAGGLDSETLCAFEEIRQQVPGHLGGSRELFAAIPSS